MQDSVSCDYFRTPVKFQGVDIYCFVGACGIGQWDANARDLQIELRFLDAFKVKKIFSLLWLSLVQ